MRPADHCPHERPFPAGFSACEAFKPVTQVVADSLSRQIGSLVTCGHLTSGMSAGVDGRFYPRCALGSPQQRHDWLAVVGRRRLEALRAVAEEFDRFSAAHREQLFKAKSEVLNARRSPTVRARLNDLIADFLNAVEQFLNDREARLVDADLPVKPLQRLVAAWCWAWADSPEMTGPGFLEGMPLHEFGPEAQALLRPAAGRAWFEPVFETEGLRVVRTWQPDGLRIAGHVDVANVNALARMLDVSPRGIHAASDMVIDMTEVTFCDLEGLRALVRTAAGMTGRGRLLIRGMSWTLQRALDIAGWSDLPNLVVAPGGGMES